MDAESILVGLNSDQRAAVLHDHETGAQLLILAGAGSGKTSVLTKRIQFRIASGVKPENILALTFTAKAAAEMRERVQALFPDAGVRLCTFHSLALHMLREKVDGKFAYEYLGFKKAPAPKDSSDREFLQEMIKLKIPAKDFSREELFGFDHSASMAKKLKPLQNRVLESGQVVFEDLIYCAIRLLEEYPQAAEYFRNCWTEILVDEYQDINPTQYRLVKNILGDRKALFVVGDDDQAIYGFRGADIGNINRFCDDFKESTLIRLEWNYRSVANVLHLANDIFQNKPLRLQKRLRAGNPRGSHGNPIFLENRQPEIWESENPMEEMQRVITSIKELRIAYDLKWNNFAILVRYNRQRLYYEEALKNAMIPVASEEVEDGIHVETVHASKGLQYAVVYYAGLAERFTPGECMGNRAERKKQLEEERRLYYVGVTRAEAYLVLLYCKRRYWKGRLVKFKKSRFLPKIPPKREGSVMPLIFFRIYLFAWVLAYMCLRMVQLPFAMLRYRKNINLWIDKHIQLFAKFCMKILRADLNIDNQAVLAKVDWTRPVFVMGNHNSFTDIPIVFLAIERTIGFIAKKELSYIPFLNFWMKKIGCILVNRKKGGGADLIRQRIANNDAPRLFIFPEGTRSKTGALGRFKSGSFRLAMECDAIILPVAIKGAGELWERRKSSAGSAVSVKVLEPIDTLALKKELGRELDPKADLMNLVKDRLQEAL